MYNGFLKYLWRIRLRQNVNNMDIVLDGWLIKLNERRLFRRTKWNKYWFVLRHSDEYSEQFLLEYYKDSSCHDIRGKIDLNQCDRVEVKYKDDSNNINEFDIQISNKVYSLVAETECDMNKWIGCICSVCGLKRKVEDDSSCSMPDTVISLPITSLSSLSSVSILQENESSCQKRNSSPYILISECFTGKPLPNFSSNIDKQDLFSENSANYFASVDNNYDYPKPLTLIDKEIVRYENNSDDWYQIPPTPRTFKTDDDDKTATKIETKPHLNVNLENNVFFYGDEQAVGYANRDIESVRKEALELAQQLEDLGLDDSGIESEQSTSPTYVFEDSHEVTNKGNEELCANQILLPPPRPPKPAMLSRLKNTSPKSFCTEQNVHNSSPSKENKFSTNAFHSAIYDKVNCVQNELLPSTKVPLPVQLDSLYDVPKPRSEDNITASIMSNCDKNKIENDFHIYNNAPPIDCLRKNSILAYEYKPSLTFTEESENIYKVDKNVHNTADESAKQIITKNDIILSPLSIDKSDYNTPPAINRRLKPRKSIGEGCRSGQISHESMTDISSPSEKLPFDIFDYGLNKNENLHMEQIKSLENLSGKPNEIQYLDLNLDSNQNTEETIIDKVNQTIVYKKVDFLRTEAFNKMRQNVEETYRNSNQ